MTLPDPAPASPNPLSSWEGARKWWSASKRRRTLIIVTLIVLVLTITGLSAISSYTSHQAELAAAAEVKAAQEAKLAQEAAEDHDKALTMAEDALSKGVAFSKDSLDYADADDALELEDALSALDKIVDADESTTAEIEAAHSRVSSAIRIIGDRPLPYDWAISCQDHSYKNHSFASFRDVWSSAIELKDCESGGRVGDFPTELQNAAVASGAISSMDSMGILYAICASLGFSHYGQMESFSEGQAKEIAGALTICPDHPAAAALQPRLDASRQLAEGIANGSIFHGGAKRVGVDIQPGTYVSEGELNGCYWERTDATGEILDNNFISSGLRAQVTVRASDYSFSSSGCGQWKKQ